MKVDHFCTYVVGGAPMAARRLHDALRRVGTDSRFWFGRASEQDQLDESYSEITWPLRRRTAIHLARAQIRRTAIRGRYNKAMTGRPPGLESFTLPELAAPTPYPTGTSPADVVNLHWIANLVDYSSFFASLPDNLPVVWTLHDMNPFTGGCHYSNECNAFLSECGHCPQISRSGVHDLANRNFHIKRNSFKYKNLHIVAPSRWLLAQAQNSRLFSEVKSIRRIPYGLDTDVYVPHEKPAAKRQLGIPADRFVVAFVAEEVDNHRKGGRHLLAALSRLADRPVTGLVLGGGQLQSDELSLPPLHCVEFVREPERQAVIYSAADALVLPSLADNLPLTGLEALSCGTPVVGFDVGGIPDYVRDGITGLLVPAGDSSMLAQKIDWLIDHQHQRQRLGDAGRKMMVDEYRADIQARRYRDLYQFLLEQPGASLRKAS